MTDQIFIEVIPSAWNLKKIIVQILKIARKRNLISEKPIVLSITGASLAQMKKINFKFRMINSPTDILSFEQYSHSSKDPVQYLGDLVVCLPIVRKQARQFKHGVRNELIVLLVHGFLHLLCYDHEKSKKKKIEMLVMEQKFLADLKTSKTLHAGLLLRNQVN